MVSSEVKFLVNSHLTVPILETGMKDLLSLRGVHATWQGHKTIPRQKTFAPTGSSLLLARRTLPAQLIAAGSRGEGREWRKATTKFSEMQSKKTAESLMHYLPTPAQTAAPSTNCCTQWECHCGITPSSQAHSQFVQCPPRVQHLKMFF